MKQYNEQTSIIDAETVYAKADAITLRAVLTDWAKSGNDFMRRMYYSTLNVAISDHTDDDAVGGADLIQDTVAYLCQYMGKSLDDTTGDGQTDKDGNETLAVIFKNFEITKAIEQEKFTQ